MMPTVSTASRCEGQVRELVGSCSGAVRLCHLHPLLLTPTCETPSHLFLFFLFLLFFFPSFSSPFLQRAGIPIYHSRPGSSNVLFLDFDGHVTDANNYWGAFDALPYDPSDNGLEFTAYEQAQIASLWAQVAEDYAPFDIDVTTEAFATQTPSTIHVLITNSRQRYGGYMPSSSAGGVAFPSRLGRLGL